LIAVLLLKLEDVIGDGCRVHVVVSE
jgi:hypothetical protein